MQSLNDLVTAAIQLAGGDAISHGNRLWQSEGCRGCPIGWEDCGQAVYVDLASGEHDYGDPGGPGHADCQRYCPHGHQPPEED